MMTFHVSVGNSRAHHKSKAVALVQINGAMKGCDLRGLIRIIKFRILRPMGDVMEKSSTIPGGRPRHYPWSDAKRHISLNNSWIYSEFLVYP
jgi:hypothetical protein